MAISYTQQRTNVPAPVAQLSSFPTAPNEAGSQPSMPSSDLLLRLWSVIQRLESEVSVERERNNTLTTQVDTLADRLAASNTLVATLSGLNSTSPATTMSSPSNIPVVAADNVPQRPSYRSVVTSGSKASTEVQQQPTEAVTTETNFPDHGVPLWHVLRSLSNVDERRVFTVRKIQKLGFESPPKLREYFSMWGKVTNILVLHRQARTASTGAETNEKSVRVRPPSVGFVVMEDPEVVSRILATPKHVICGHSCEVQVFERKHRHATGESLSSCSDSATSSQPSTSPMSSGTNDDRQLPEFMRELRSGSMAVNPFDEVPTDTLLPSRAFSTGFESCLLDQNQESARRFTTSSVNRRPYSSVWD
ncbi:acyl-protein thioesterase [Perkinsus chesapeaki]|uniref:Acyl-protein thioesterase n=1 Tax=Perkinsus chesapeaki TaxID=330153 RepID=A0A7J6M1K2_PERCH|nr:acyl-protein thioesterase [Perkinsus chesapeaki]